MATLLGTAGRDVLGGTRRDDSFDGRGGGDVYVAGGVTGFDSYRDGGAAGTDRIVAVGDGTSIGLAGGFGPDSGIEVISARGHEDVSIQGGKGSDRLDFSATMLVGVTKISGGGGSDRIEGGAGDDDIRGNNRSDTIRGGDGDDRICGGDSNDFAGWLDNLHGPDGEDALFGGAGRDELAGGHEDDSLDGGAGADRLVGGAGADRLAGGAGADAFAFAIVTEGGDTIVDWQDGVDRIDLSAVDADRRTPGDDAFRVAAGARANAVWAEVVDGTTVVRADGDGDAVADLVLTLAGVHALTAEDFAL